MTSDDLFLHSPVFLAFCHIGFLFMHTDPRSRRGPRELDESDKSLKGQTESGKNHWIEFRSLRYTISTSSIHTIA